LKRILKQQGILTAQNRAKRIRKAEALQASSVLEALKPKPIIKDENQVYFEVLPKKRNTSVYSTFEVSFFVTLMLQAISSSWPSEESESELPLHDNLSDVPASTSNNAGATLWPCSRANMHMSPSNPRPEYLNPIGCGKRKNSYKRAEVDDGAHLRQYNRILLPKPDELDTRNRVHSTRPITITLTVTTTTSTPVNPANVSRLVAGSNEVVSARPRMLEGYKASSSTSSSSSSSGGAEEVGSIKQQFQATSSSSLFLKPDHPNSRRQGGYTTPNALPKVCTLESQSR
jgi:hypothetical protein